MTSPSPGVVVTPQPLNDPPRHLIQVTTLYTIPSSQVTVTRRNSDGSSYAIRSANPAAMSAGAGGSMVWTGYDYDAPFAQPGVYTATDDLGRPLSSATVPMLREYGVQTPWLLHPGIPSLSMPITVARPGPVPVSDVNQGVFNVLGRKDPVIRTDGVRRAPTFTLTISTYSWAEGDQLQALLDDASTLLLQITYPDWERGSYWWVSVGTVTPSNMVDYYGNEYVQWALACTVTGPPVGLLQAQWSYAGVAGRYATYLDVLNSFATYEDLLIDNPIAS